MLASSRPADRGRGRLVKTTSAARAIADTTAATVETTPQTMTRSRLRCVTTMGTGDRASDEVGLASLDRPGMELAAVMLPLSDRLLSEAPLSALSGPSASCEKSAPTAANAAAAFTSPKPTSTR